MFAEGGILGIGSLKEPPVANAEGEFKLPSGPDVAHKEPSQWTPKQGNLGGFKNCLVDSYITLSFQASLQ